MRLVIQTTIPGQLSVWLVQSNKIIDSRFIKIDWHRSDQALWLIDNILETNKKKLHQLKGITVVRGPGSFTAVRVGIIIANTIGKLFDIPIRGIVKFNKLTSIDVLHQVVVSEINKTGIRPWYGKSPNISYPKIKKTQVVT